MRLKTKIFLAGGILLLPSTAFADLSSPLMWASALHMVFGNAIIGLFEGVLLAWWFKAPRWKSILILIVANYVSTWAGTFLVIDRLARIPDLTIANIGMWLWLFVILAFAVSLLFVFPFFLFALRKTPGGLPRAMKATVIIHSISFLLLFGWYWLASGTTLMAELELVSAEKIRPDGAYVLYYITPDGSRIVRTDLVGKAVENVSELSATHGNDRLFVRRDAAGNYDLFVYLDSGGSGVGKENLVARNFSDLAPLDWPIAEGQSDNAEGTGENFGLVPSLASASDWNYHTGSLAVEGINGIHQKDGSRFHFSFEIPFAAWAVRNATQIEGDYVVFQLGQNQICILQPQKRKIALIARGKGPIVAEPKTSGR